MKVRKAVIPAAGLGTRFLPVTKSMPKEMLPIIDTPAIHYVVKEAIEAGIDDIIIITGRGKRAVEDYFDESPELEMHLRENKKNELLRLVRSISSMANIHYIRQKEPRGLPDAILKAEKHVDDETFAVLLGDDIIKNNPSCIGELIEVFDKYDSPVIAAERIPMEKITRYGSIVGEEVKSSLRNKLYLIEDIVEKPKASEAPSNIASVGRYIFTPEVFDCIKKTPLGLNNEYQISDTIKILMKSQKVYAYEFSGKRYDIGDKFGYVQAVIDFALENREIGREVLGYIKKRFNQRIV
ncbi:MAG: UTP--glucose-1-phosphate uridylyltransferase [Thermoplasmata archaeon]|nr:MAG: UTP--glucose-1-phosphate uridylyltransferase [Thermoplasmata archaeon]